MIVQNNEELQKLRHIGGIVARCLEHMIKCARAGMSLKELDQIAAQFLAASGARSAPILMYEFPGHTCLSLAPVAAHGIPDDRRLVDGDLLNIDVSAEKDGFFGDTGGSFFIGQGDAEGERLLKATREALNLAMTVAQAGKKIHQIGKKIEIIASRYNYEIIENLGSHGVGRSLHEEPKFIASYFDPDDTRVLLKNQVITIEPFLSTKSFSVDEAEDGWSLVASDGGLSAQFEHTLVITDGLPLIMTDPANL